MRLVDKYAPLIKLRPSEQAETSDYAEMMLDIRNLCHSGENQVLLDRNETEELTK